MKIFYACEICGHTSGDQKQIQVCENQGKRNLYQKGQRVAFMYGKNGGTPVPLEGIISGIEYKHKNHQVSYSILSDGKVVKVSDGAIQRALSETD